MTIAHIEVTDLFNGEANYSWVQRFSFPLDDSVSDLALVRRAKKVAGYSGLRTRTEHFGDWIRLDFTPSGIQHVLYISFEN